ncbi:putative CCR4-associated factor 1 like 11 [Dendrobium catenatum]|uniref:Putative CCR4-associated factor 1 like 11 n=1 Tax=Dendrobium catenatum TaxID=906689 RepID=A0A2I0W7S4_9ASPA|nr:putative CCR4-associated factor 1 like 11 [Dendrobium catenatum]
MKTLKYLIAIPPSALSFPAAIFDQLSITARAPLADCYSLLKLNTDVNCPIQVGITFSDGGTSTFTWQFELRDFDLRCYPHSPDSIALLESSWINLTGNGQSSIPSTWQACAASA